MNRNNIAGCRPDLDNRYFRSAMEANYARYLNFLLKYKYIHKWEYEPDVFWFEGIKRGTRSYLPDFKIWETINEDPYYVETKGWMDQRSKTKIKRMGIYHPKTILKIVTKKEMKEIKEKVGSMIENWE
jgi:hypothetical protein